MTPAPKSRVPKGEVVAAENPIPAKEENLIDIDDDQTPKPQTLRRNATLDGPPIRLNGSHSDVGTSPKDASYLRRTSSMTGASDREGPPKRANTTELREHLRHLGPSNLASRPRQTRYNTVKIKPGGGSIAENASKAQEFTDTSGHLSLPAAPQGGVGAGLLGSAGKDAKDGVQAVQAGYGSIETSPKTPKKGDQGFQLDKEEDNTYQNSGRSRPDSSNSQSTLGSLNGASRRTNPRRFHNVARSGSITENIVDMGGIKKTVLELTSSSSDDIENQTADDKDDQNQAQVENESLEEDGSGDGKENDGKAEGGGKKKRRRRKRKGAKGDEDTPLLER